MPPPPTEQGQKLVEKLLKDKLYTMNEVGSFLRIHQDTIDLEIPDNQVPSKVILSLVTQSISPYAIGFGQITWIYPQLKIGMNSYQKSLNLSQFRLY